MASDTATLALSDQDVVERLHEAAAWHLRALERNSGGRLDPRVVNGATGVYNVFRKAHFATGRDSGYITYFELAQALYPDVMNGEDSVRKKQSIHNQLRRHVAAGTLRITVHTTEAGQNLGLWWELASEAPDPEAWPDLKSYSGPRYPHRAGPCSSIGVATATRRAPCKLKRREKLHRADPRRRVHRWNRRIGHGAEPRYDLQPVSPAFFSDETFCATTSLPTPQGPTARGGGQASEVRERRAHASPSPRPWAALTRCRTAAGGGGALAVLDVPRAGWAAMAAAAFEARFVVDGWQTLGDPHEMAREPGAEHNPQLDPPDHKQPFTLDGDELATVRYVTLSGPWAGRLETWCRTYDRSAKQPGAGIRSLVEDIVEWEPADGAPTRTGRDPGWPVSLAFFVARLGRRAKQQRGQVQRKRRRNTADWAMGERW